MKYVFGPVASRRLGVSLGVDLVPPKTCSLDCVYCEAGKTNCLTAERKEYVPTQAVIAELEDYLKTNPKLDFITFSGSGEPTLHSHIGEIIRFIKQNYPGYRVCVLTNATTFGDPALVKDLDAADIVIPSLDASSKEEFRKINRPAPGVTFDKFLADLTAFCRQTHAQVILELFIVPKVNDSDEAIARFAAIVRELKVAKVQLNTLDRPGTESDIIASPRENTLRFIDVLEKIVPVEAVGPYRYKSAGDGSKLVQTQAHCRVLELIERRPATVQDMAETLGLNIDHLQNMLDRLFDAGLVEIEKGERGNFYRKVNR